jgi:hypothetical protein
METLLIYFNLFFRLKNHGKFNSFCFICPKISKEQKFTFPFQWLTKCTKRGIRGPMILEGYHEVTCKGSSRFWYLKINLKTRKKIPTKTLKLTLF